jgi:hypothetical protein
MVAATAAITATGTITVTDRLTVVLLAVATLLLVLALLAGQLRPTATLAARRPVVVLRRVYETKVVETIPGSSGSNGTSVSQSVSSSGVAAAPSAPTTRSS